MNLSCRVALAAIVIAAWCVHATKRIRRELETIALFQTEDA